MAHQNGHRLVRAASLIVACFVMFVAGLTLSGDADARRGGGVQRMSIAPGTYKVPPRAPRGPHPGGGGGGGGGSAALPAFCLDYDKAPPQSGDVFTNVSAGAEDVVVRFGTEAMSLQAAQKRKLVRVRGPSIEEQLFGDGPGPGEMSLIFENLDPKGRDMTVEVRQAPVLGTQTSKHELLTSADVMRSMSLAQSSGGKVNPQAGLWALEELRKTGYGKAGDDEAARRGAVDRFQQQQGLPRSGQLDENTVDALLTQAGARKTVREAEAGAGGSFRVLMLTKQSDPQAAGFYRVHSTDSPSKRVDATDSLVTEINRIARNSRPGMVYIMLDPEFRPQDRKALEISLKAKGGDIEPRLIVRDLEFELADGMRLFEPVGTAVSLARVGKLEKSADGIYRQQLRLTSKDAKEGPVELTLESKKPSLIERFLAKLQAIFSKPGEYLSLSYLALIQKAKSQLAADLGISRKQLDEELRLNLEGVQVAEERTISIAHR